MSAMTIKCPGCWQPVRLVKGRIAAHPEANWEVALGDGKVAWMECRFSRAEVKEMP